MSATDRTPNTRLFALAAFIIAAGILSLRAYDLFGSVKTDPIGSAAEQEITYLLEPITGADKVRVSMTGLSQKTVLIMIDGEVSADLRPLRTQIENVLSASIGFDTDRDTLTLSQFPFARGVGSRLTPLQIAELAGLGLLSLLLAGHAVGARQTAAPHAPPRTPKPMPSPRQPARLAPPAAPEPDYQNAAALAESQPGDTARLVRGWMTYAED
ncbi:MAG: hypothetical protein AAFR51_15980 [Pseudomonadota bacterium]